MVDNLGMAGTNERRESLVDDGWEPMKPSGPRPLQIVLIFAAAMVIVPLVAFWGTYTLLSR